jgi:hypothetical protein
VQHRAIARVCRTHWLVYQTEDSGRQVSDADVMTASRHLSANGPVTLTRVRALAHVQAFVTRGARASGGVGTLLQAGRSQVRIPIRLFKFVSLPNPSKPR